jgi:hypothetical protein
MFGLPCLYAAWYLADRGHVWTFMGFPTYGEGPSRTSASRRPFCCSEHFCWSAELAAGWMLWQRRRAGVVLALALLPLEFAFWIGFGVPLHGRFPRGER